jgi:hypothetical protein
MFDHDGTGTFSEARRVICRTVVHDQHEREMLAHRHDESRDAGTLIETRDHGGTGCRFKHGDSLKLIPPGIEAKLFGQVPFRHCSCKKTHKSLTLSF